MSTVIERKDKKQITKDWLSLFPEFKEYKPMWIIRRNDMFLCGIHLQTHSGNWDYEPIFHIYNLMVDFPVISLGAATYLLNRKGANDRVTLLQHKDDFSSYAERLKQQVSLLKKNTFNCEELVSYLKMTVNNSIGYPSETLKDIILLLYWCGKVEEAEKELENAKKIMSQWDDDVWVIKHLGVNGWEQQVQQLMNINTLRATVEKQLQKYKLKKLIDYQLNC
jgi:hypothetical protein